MTATTTGRDETLERAVGVRARVVQPWHEPLDRHPWTSAALLSDLHDETPAQRRARRTAEHVADMVATLPHHRRSRDGQEWYRVVAPDTTVGLRVRSQLEAGMREDVGCVEVMAFVHRSERFVRDLLTCRTAEEITEGEWERVWGRAQEEMERIATLQRRSYQLPMF